MVARISHPTKQRRAIIIGAGIGGLALGIRLQSLGFDTTILEKLDGPGGRAYTRKVGGFTFDMGPTVITVPHFIEELFALERGDPNLDQPDFPAQIFDESSASDGSATSRYATLVPVSPFYRIYFDDGTHFDFDSDEAHTREQIRRLAPDDLDGYERFQVAAKAIFERGFLQLGHTHFGTLPDMLRIAPDLLRLDAVRPLFGFVKKFFKHPKMQRVFSFEPLLIGGNPLSVPAIYAMIHFVEKTWGIHFVVGGTGALVQGFARKFEELGGVIRYNAEVARIVVTDPAGRKPTRFGRKVARGVAFDDGTVLDADLVVSNADWANTYAKLIDPSTRVFNTDRRVAAAKQSMSLVVVYFGFRAADLDLKLRHHNIILSARYEELLKDIFDRRVLSGEASHYLHLPTLTDPSLAPPGHHAAYSLTPVPNNGSGIDWAAEGPRFADRVVAFLDDAGYIPDLRRRLVHKSFITPDYFERTLNSRLGNAFGLEPVLRQTAFFRPHNRSEDIENLYLVGANCQPGGGTPAVMMGAKMTARLIAEDFGIARAG